MSHPGPIAALFVVLQLASVSALPGQSAPVVAGFERFHRDAAGEPKTAAAGGRLLLGELGCVRCHASAAIAPRPAPRLARVAERMHHERLRALVTAPHVVKPGTTMPDVWRDVPAARRDAEVDAIVHLLVSLRPDAFTRVATDEPAADRGAALFTRVGCAACHAPLDADRVPANSVPLPRAMANDYSLEAMARFLRAPQAVRPGARMPSLHLAGREARDLAHYLLRGTRVPGALHYTVWHGPLISFDDFEDRVPFATGVTDGFDIAIARRHNDYSLRFAGELRIERAGSYTFHLNSDDGSRLFLGEELALDNDGVRRRNEPLAKSVTRDLAAGWQPFAVEYFQRGREAVLEFEWEGPGVARGPVPVASLRASAEPVAAYEPLAVDAAKVARGREAFAARGCVACHDDVVPAPAAAASSTALPRLADLDPARGCLAPVPPAGVPDYRLDPRQRAALVAALGVGNTELGAATRVAHTMQTFGCYACHAREGVGGVADDRDAFFVSNGTDLGDEGRVPPDLTGVGDKLRRPWLEKVLVEGASVRPYLGVRMPRYEVDALRSLAADFVALDRELPPAAQTAAQPTPASPDSPEALREAGRKLIGVGGVSCILCHDHNRRRAATMNVVDLVTATERLNEDWFDRFLRSPESFRAGTRMPSFWAGGYSPVADVLDGDASRQIHALWTYLSDGRRAKDPEGLDRKSLELIVAGEAIVYRGKLWEAGFRGIAVGYPDQVNAAFDAEQGRLALLWKGRFLDVSAHWRVQGMGRVRPRGHAVRVLPPGSAFAVLADADATWPQLGEPAAAYRFVGYDLGAANVPTFRYAWGTVAIEDTARVRMNGERATFERTLQFDAGGPIQDLWLRLASGRRIEAVDARTFRIDGELTCRVDAGRVVTLGDTAELRVPVKGAREPRTLVVEYEW